MSFHSLLRTLTWRREIVERLTAAERHIERQEQAIARMRAEVASIKAAVEVAELEVEQQVW